MLQKEREEMVDDDKWCIHILCLRSLINFLHINWLFFAGDTHFSQLTPIITVTYQIFEVHNGDDKE